MGLRFRVYGLRFVKGMFLCRKIVFGILCFLIFSLKLNAQVGTTSFGFVVKPIFPSSYFRTGAETKVATDTIGNTYQFKLAQTSGFSAGAVLRKGITKNISVETGIQYVKRHYQLDITDDSTGFKGGSDFKIIGYEIPIQVLTLVQLSREIWMNVSLGTSFKSG